MIRARVVVGDPALCAEVERDRRALRLRPRRSRPTRSREIQRLRMRMEHELAGDERAEFNIKTGRGGLVDIEFLVQMLQLRHGADLPAVRLRATRHALAALAAAGVVPRDDAASLEQSYAFLRALANRLRIERDQPVEALERAGEGVADAGAPARLRGYERGGGAPPARRLRPPPRTRPRAVQAVVRRSIVTTTGRAVAPRHARAALRGGPRARRSRPGPRAPDSGGKDARACSWQN